MDEAVGCVLAASVDAQHDDRVWGESIFSENHDWLLDAPFTLLAILSLKPL